MPPRRPSDGSVASEANAVRRFPKVIESPSKSPARIHIKNSQVGASRTVPLTVNPHVERAVISTPGDFLPTKVATRRPHPCAYRAPTAHAARNRTGCVTGHERTPKYRRPALLIPRGYTCASDVLSLEARDNRHAAACIFQSDHAIWIDRSSVYGEK